MLDTNLLIDPSKGQAWPQDPVHVRVTGYGDGQLIYILSDRCGVRLIGAFEVTEFRMDAVKVLSNDEGGAS